MGYCVACVRACHFPILLLVLLVLSSHASVTGGVPPPLPPTHTDTHFECAFWSLGVWGRNRKSEFTYPPPPISNLRFAFRGCAKDHFQTTFKLSKNHFQNTKNQTSSRQIPTQPKPRQIKSQNQQNHLFIYHLPTKNDHPHLQLDHSQSRQSYSILPRIHH